MSAQRLTVVLGLTPRAEQTLEQWLYGPAAELQAVASVGAADELARTLLQHPEATLLFSADLSGLEAGDLRAAQQAGVCVVGVALDARERLLLEGLAAGSIVEAPFSGEQLRAAACPGDPDGGLAVSQELPARTRPGGAGNVVAVVGSRGAPGVSECAASLAALAGRRWPTLLVEFDLGGGGLDVRLGADPGSGSLAALLRALARDPRAPGELLERWLVEPAGWPSVLLAPPATRLPGRELSQPGLVRASLAALASLYPLVVCEVGYLIDPACESAVARAHADVLRSADAVLLVVGAREVQLGRGLSQLRLLLEELALPRERLRLLLNGSGGPGSAREAEQALTASLAEHGLALDAVLPWDRRALSRSLRRGLPLACALRRGRYRRALERFLAELFLPGQPVPRTGKRRLAPAAAPAHTGEQEVALPWRG